MKKSDMIDYLDSYGVESKNLTFAQIRTLYWNKRRENGDLISQQNKSVVDIVDDKTLPGINEDGMSETPKITTPPITVPDSKLKIEDSEKQLVKEMASPFYGHPRHELMKQIVPLMKELSGKSRGTNEQVHRLIYLHNQFYNRRDSVGCQTCVGKVHARMVALYKKYKEFYD